MDDGENGRAMEAVQLLARLVRERVYVARRASIDDRLDRRFLIEGSTILLAGIGCLVFGAALLGRFRAERLLQARLDALMENAAAGIAIFDADLRCLRANAPFTELLPADSRRTPAFGQVLGSLMPDDRGLLEPACATVLSSGRRVENLSLRRGSGTLAQRDWLVSVFPILDQVAPTKNSRGETPGATAVGLMTVEVTAPESGRTPTWLPSPARRATAGTARPQCHETGRLLADRPSSRRRTSRLWRDPGALDACRGGGRLDRRKRRGKAWPLRPSRDYGDLVSDELMQAHVVAVSDIRTDPRIDADGTRDMYAGRGIVAFAMVLVVQGGHPCAIFGVSDTAPRAWSKTDLLALRDAANRSWSAVERGRAVFELREREQQFERAIAGAGIGVWTGTLRETPW